MLSNSKDIGFHTWARRGVSWTLIECNYRWQRVQVDLAQDQVHWILVCLDGCDGSSSKQDPFDLHYASVEDSVEAGMSMLDLDQRPRITWELRMYVDGERTRITPLNM